MRARTYVRTRTTCVLLVNVNVNTYTRPRHTRYTQLSEFMCCTCVLYLVVRRPMHDVSLL